MKLGLGAGRDGRRNRRTHHDRCRRHGVRGITAAISGRRGRQLHAAHGRVRRGRGRRSPCLSMRRQCHGRGRCGGHGRRAGGERGRRWLPARGRRACIRPATLFGHAAAGLRAQVPGVVAVAPTEAQASPEFVAFPIMPPAGGQRRTKQRGGNGNYFPQLHSRHLIHLFLVSPMSGRGRSASSIEIYRSNRSGR